MVGGQPTGMAMCWSLLGIKIVTELMLIFQKENGHKLLVSMISSSSTQDTVTLGLPVTPPLPAAVGLDSILKYMVEKLFSLISNGTNVEVQMVNLHLSMALNGSAFNILDLTHMSEFRADVNSSSPSAVGKKHDNCMHWCLPGVTDTWRITCL
ncbi:protein trichome birefringence-like 13 isoform X2 [Rhododendron vialii]|uniref:protein trichome birefringence-like 13 isoform X2 n=1 Tax=Rhododendron vialii TaxID=182163 RepID=UPI00265D6935|nr:protein trichome birefringence-like 13 isoform X2 [Rhododendron vialii]